MLTRLLLLSFINYSNLLISFFFYPAFRISFVFHSTRAPILLEPSRFLLYFFYISLLYLLLCVSLILCFVFSYFVFPQLGGATSCSPITLNSMRWDCCNVIPGACLTKQN
jgi:hypothetical protein